jgi:dipeptidyl-peptidase-3
MKGSGDQKFTTGLDLAILKKLSTRSPRLSSLYDAISASINAVPPFSLGYPSDTTQSSYYPGRHIEKQDIELVSRVLEQKGIFPENTRIQRTSEDNMFEVLVASVASEESCRFFDLPGGKGKIKTVLGDHSLDLQRVCEELSLASNYAASDLQRQILEGYIESFKTGSLEKYRDSLRLWVADKSPRVEHIFGFVEPYRDPHGTRAEFEALVAISDDDETKLLTKLVEQSDMFIRRLPWAATENDGKGPFEKSLFESPDFSSIHSEDLHVSTCKKLL